MGSVKNNGGARKGAGRKPKADEIKQIELMDSVGAPKEAWAKLWGLVEEENVHAIKTWLAYRYGRPKETQELTVNKEVPLFPDVQTD